MLEPYFFLFVHAFLNNEVFRYRTVECFAGYKQNSSEDQTVPVGSGDPTERRENITDTVDGAI